MERTGRNQPCPCGSGTKYKHCCSRGEQLKRIRGRSTPRINPRREFLSRRPQPAVEAVCNWMSEGIAECVNYGTHVLAWCIEKPIGGYADATIVSVFRHLLSTIDGISVLVRHGCADAAIPLLRTALETELGLAYMLKDDTTNRALAYQVAHVQAQLSYLRKLNKKSPQGKTFRRMVARDPSADFSTIDQDAELYQEEEKRLQAVLSKPEYQRISAEWDRLKSEGKSPRWYSLFEGPSTLEELAYQMGAPLLYELLYRDWSHAVHGTGALRRLSRHRDGATPLELRFPGDLQEVSHHSILIMARALKQLVRTYRPDKVLHLGNWYLSNIHPMVEAMANDKIISIVEPDE